MEVYGLTLVVNFVRCDVTISGFKRHNSTCRNNKGTCPSPCFGRCLACIWVKAIIFHSPEVVPPFGDDFPKINHDSRVREDRVRS